MAFLEFREIEVVSKDALKNAVQSALQESGRFKTYNIEVVSPHASYVEYGTGPSTANSPEADEFGRTVKERIAEWVDEKVQNDLTPRQKRDMAFSIYKKIMQEGLPPMPFIRPAIDEILGDPQNVKILFETGDGMLNIANAIADRMREIITREGHIFRGELLNSIFVTEANEGEFTKDGEVVEYE